MCDHIQYLTNGIIHCWGNTPSKCGSPFLHEVGSNGDGKKKVNSVKDTQVIHSLQLCLQIRSSGGPMPQTTIDYTIDNPTVATVGDAGLIVAKVPGNATVTGKVGSLSVCAVRINDSGKIAK